MVKSLSRETISQLGKQKKDFPAFKVGDRIAVSQRIKEGNKERVQVFEGDVIAAHNKGVSSTFTVRKISANAVSVERIFPYGSPLIESIKFIRHGDVRRAKLYYMRDRIGKAAHVKERIVTAEQRKQQAEAVQHNEQVAQEEPKDTQSE